MRTTTIWTLLGAAGLALLCACGDSGGTNDPGGEDGFTDPDGPPEETRAAFLSPTDHLTRASIALRGVRPSVRDLNTVRDDPGALPGLVDAYLETPEFGESIRDLHNETWQVRSFFHTFPALNALQEVDLTRINRSVSESPLRLIEHVVMNDRPYSEILTADYTVADGVTSEVWGMDYNGDGDTWVETRWPEQGRPHAGILSNSFLFVRHDTTASNLNRGRANAVTKGLLCHDFLENDVTIDGNVDLSDPVAVANAVQSNPACSTCHQGLDPLGHFFWIYELRFNTGQIQQQFGGYPFSTYRPEYIREVRRRFPTFKPGYFGTIEPEEEEWDIRQLAAFILDDPRFASCTARRFYAYFNQVGLREVPFETLSDLQETFVNSGMSAKELAKAVVLSDAFRTSHMTDEAIEGIEYTNASLKKVRPGQMARMVEDLTGFRWTTELPINAFGGTYGHTDLMRDSLLGFNVLAGGTDAFQVPKPSHATGATTVLVQRALATEAAGYTVERDFERDAERRYLLTEVDPNDTDEALVRTQLALLHLRILSEHVATDSETVDRTYALFEAARNGDEDTSRAWKTVLMALFQDVRFIFH